MLGLISCLVLGARHRESLLSGSRSLLLLPAPRRRVEIADELREIEIFLLLAEDFGFDRGSNTVGIVANFCYQDFVAGHDIEKARRTNNRQLYFLTIFPAFLRPRNFSNATAFAPYFNNRDRSVKLNAFRRSGELNRRWSGSLNPGIPSSLTM